MQVITGRRLLLLVAMVGLACGWAVAGRGQQPTGGRAAGAPRPDGADYLGAARCAGCHKSPTPLFVNRGALEYVRLNEYDVWSERDKHAVAYRTLLEPQATQIGELLRIDVARDQSCLGCHAGWRRDLPRPSDANLQDGVSCESCHGPSRNWDLPHSERAWRTRPAADKAMLGMINVRDRLERAGQCLSCHIGDREQGKVLTHEMYAAGHPPLPSIEIESFIEQMPRHWRYLEEKETLPEEERRQLRDLLGQPSGSLHRAKGVLVGGVMALRQIVDLLDSEFDGKQTWPDFAQFDCSMCHHELQTPSWRQVRGDAGRPGRPQLAVWPAALVDAGIASAAGRNAGAASGMPGEFQQRLDRLHAVFAAQPFGDPAQIGDAGDPRTVSGGLAQWLDELAERINAQPCDRPAALAALRRLSELPPARLPDYDSARQTAWAFRAIYQELDPPPAADAEVQSVLASLDQELGLQLRDAQPPGTGGGSSGWYAAIGKYDPRRFREQMEILGKALGVESP